MPITHIQPVFPNWMPPQDRVRVIALDVPHTAQVWSWAANSSKPKTALLDIKLMSDEEIQKRARIVAKDEEVLAMRAVDEADAMAERKWIAEAEGELQRPAIKTKRVEARFAFDDVMQEVNAFGATRVILWAFNVGPIADVLHLARRLNRVSGVEVLVVLHSTQSDELQLVDKATYSSDDGFALRVGFDTVYRVVGRSKAPAAAHAS